MSLFCNDVLLPSWGKLAVAEVLLVIWTQWSRKPSDREISVSVRERANGKRQQENEKRAAVPGLRLKTDWEDDGSHWSDMVSPVHRLLQRSCQHVTWLRAAWKGLFPVLSYQGKQWSESSFALHILFRKLAMPFLAEVKWYQGQQGHSEVIILVTNLLSLWKVLM